MQKTIVALLGTAIVLAGTASPSLAADVTIADTVVDWSGFYVGALAGYGQAHSETSWQSVTGDGQKFSNCIAQGDESTSYNGCAPVTFDPGGFAGAVEAGYDLQHGNLVVGAVVGFGYMDISGSERDNTNLRDRRTDNYMSTDSGLYGSAALRAGVAIDKILVFGKGGGAVYFGDSHVDDSCVLGPGCGPGRVHASGDGSRLGWTLGAGAEYRLSDSWNLKLEYDYYDFGSDKLSGKAEFVADGVTNATAKESWTNSLTAQTVMAGFDYRF